MKYYLHDSTAFSDEKITELYMKFGYEGLGLFYTALEKFALQEKPIKTEVLKKQLNVGKKLEKCWSFMEEIGIISSNNGETFNKQLLNFSEKYQIKKQKNVERVKQWRENQQVKENVTRNEHVRNTPKVNGSKVNGSKVNDIEERKLKFSSSLSNYLDKYGREILNEFYKYWTEPNKSNTKFRQELEKTWDLERRLETWAKNEKNFSKNKTQSTPQREQTAGGIKLSELERFANQNS